METLKLGERLKTREPQVLLDPELRPGRYRVQLVIESARGTSVAAQIDLIVVEPRRTPTDPLTPVTPLTPVRPFAPISRVADIPAATVTAAIPKPKPSPKKKAKAKTPVKPKPVKPKPVKPKRK